MSMVVQTNNAAVTALKHLNVNNDNMNKALERLSSGFRINSAADDAAGFAIASKLNAQGGRLKAAAQNAAQAMAMVKMADAGINEIQNMLNRIQVLATQAASANNDGERAKLDAERQKLELQIDKIANSTKYNGVALLNGSNGATATLAAGGPAGVAASVKVNGAAAGSYTLTVAAAAGGTGFDITLDNGAGVTQTVAAVIAPGAGTTKDVSFGNLGLTVTVDANLAAGTGTITVTAGNASTIQVGADNNADNRVTVNLGNSYTTTSLYAAYTGTATTGLTTATDAQNYIDKAKAALDKLVTQRADLGATQNQLSFVQANLATSIEQVTASVSTIRDADMAAEMANFTKSQVLVQAGTAMLAQANQASQNVLRLFR